MLTRLRHSSPRCADAAATIGHAGSPRHTAMAKIRDASRASRRTWCSTISPTITGRAPRSTSRDHRERRRHSAPGVGLGSAAWQQPVNNVERAGGLPRAPSRHRQPAWNAANAYAPPGCRAVARRVHERADRSRPLGQSLRGQLGVSGRRASKTSWSSQQVRTRRSTPPMRQRPGGGDDDLVVLVEP